MPGQQEREKKKSTNINRHINQKLTQNSLSAGGQQSQECERM